MSTRLDDDARVLRMAAEIAARTRPEQLALLRVARRIDAEWNAQTIDNVRLRGVESGPCTYSDDHTKCKCAPPRKGAPPMLVREPRGGWSRLTALVEDTYEPEVKQ